MMELIMNMLVCLLGALALGFIFGYFITKAFGKKKHMQEVEELSGELELKGKENNHLKGELYQAQELSASTLAKLNLIIEKKEEEINSFKEKLSTLQKELNLESLKLEEADEEIESLNFIIKKKNEDNDFLKDKLLEAKDLEKQYLLKVNELQREKK